MSIRTSLALAAIPVLLAAGAGNAAAAVSQTPSAMFLKLDGAPGESADPLHPGEIDVKSFHLTATNTAGRVTFGAAELTKTYDKSSPALLQDVSSGKHLASATFSFRRPGTEGFLTYKLTDVVVASYEQGGEATVSPLLEHVGLTFSKIQVSYTPVAGPPLVTAGWDLKLNAPA
jgi:type VI secretion system secreted protein Hcp